MTHSVLSKAEGVQMFPFPHIVIQDALPWDYYETLEKTRPEQEICSKAPKESNIRFDLHTKDTLGMGLNPVWQEFIAYHTSREFWFDVMNLFEDAIRLIHPHLEWAYGRMDTWSAGVRNLDTSLLQMECQPGINTPVRQRDTVVGPHLDNPLELYAGLLYMKADDEPDGGDLQIYRCPRTPEFHGKIRLTRDQMDYVDTVKYEPNTFVMFLNTLVSFHGVTPRPVTTKTRKLVNIIGELPHKIFTTGYAQW